MDAAKPSSGAKSTPTANDPGAAPKPAEGVPAGAAKRPDQMFVVQKSGPVAPGTQPGTAGSNPGMAGVNAFRAAIGQGGGARPIQPTAADQAPAAPASGTHASGGQPPSSQAPGSPAAGAQPGHSQSATPVP